MSHFYNMIEILLEWTGHSMSPQTEQKSCRNTKRVLRECGRNLITRKQRQKYWRQFVPLLPPPRPCLSRSYRFSRSFPFFFFFYKQTNKNYINKKHQQEQSGSRTTRSKISKKLHEVWWKLCQVSSSNFLPCRRSHTLTYTRTHAQKCTGSRPTHWPVKQPV